MERCDAPALPIVASFIDNTAPRGSHPSRTAHAFGLRFGVHRSRIAHIGSPAVPLSLAAHAPFSQLIGGCDASIAWIHAALAPAASAPAAAAAAPAAGGAGAAVDLSTTSGGHSGAVYETSKAVAEYLQFHFGQDDEILPFACGPKTALNFPTRWVLALRARRSPAFLPSATWLCCWRAREQGAWTDTRQLGRDTGNRR